MWIASVYGFFSVVRAHAPGGFARGAGPRPHPDLMMVRARRREHLVALWDGVGSGLGPRPRILENTGTDYPCRFIVPAEVAWKLVARLAAVVDYTNFKNAAMAARPADTGYLEVLCDTWVAGLAITPPGAGGGVYGTEDGGLGARAEHGCVREPGGKKTGRGKGGKGGKKKKQKKMKRRRRWRCW